MAGDEIVHGELLAFLLRLLLLALHLGLGLVAHELGEVFQVEEVIELDKLELLAVQLCEVETLCHCSLASGVGAGDEISASRLLY